jgi:predicted O-methyltransferase YrrM
MLDASLIATLDFGGGHACTPAEYAFLGALVRLTAPRSIVEIGTSTGIGTLVMAAALLDAGVEAPRLTTIDLPLGRTTFGDGLARNRAAVSRLAPGVDAVIDWRLGDSHAVLDALVSEGRRADFVFIDGGHSEAIVRGDWIRALALQPRIVVLHDTVHLADVARVVDELSARYPDGDRTAAVVVRQLDACTTPGCLRDAYAQWQAYFDDNYDLGDVLDYL